MNLEKKFSTSLVIPVYNEQSKISELIKKISDKEYMVSALISIDEFNQEFKTDFSNKEFDTLGGIVLNHFARFPKTNDAISIDNLRFIIASTEKRRLKKIKVIKTK